MKLMALAGLCLSLVQAGERTGKEAPRKFTLYFFFSEKSRGAPQAARAVKTFLASHPGDGVLRPAFLVQDWAELCKITEDSPLFRTLRELLVQVAVYDEEALRLAARWKIRRLPAVVLVKDGRAHVLQGTDLDLDSLLGCSR